MKNLFLFNKKTNKNKYHNHEVDKYKEIAELVREARIKQNLTIKELSYISKIPSHIISSIEDNNKDIRPKFPFIRSILIKLEECLALKNELIKLAIPDKKIINKENKDFLLNKFDLINTWQGTLIYFFILILSIFILKRYFILNVNVIEIKNIEKKITDK